MKRVFIPIISLLLLTGCWDRVEINDLAFVTSTGVDKEEENKFTVAVQVPLPGAMGGTGSSGGGGGTEGGPYYVDSAEGRNVRESNDKLQKKMSRKLYFGHRRVILFGEKIAKEGFRKSLNVVLEQPQSRISSYVLLTKGNTMDVLVSTPHMEKINAEASREMAKTFMELSVKDVLNDMERPGKDPVIPVIETIQTQNGSSEDKKDELMISGVGIFKGEKLAYYANEKETSGALWLVGKMARKNFTFPIDKNGEINVQIEHAKTKIKANTNGLLPSFDLTVNVSSDIMQNEPLWDLSEKKSYQDAVGKMEKEIKSQIEAVLSHSLKEGIDVAGLGWHLYLYENRLWEKKWAKNWTEILQEIDVNIKVNAEIIQSVNPGIQVGG